MSFTDSSRSWCAVCGGFGSVAADVALKRKRVCTCGAGLFDAMTMHDGDCDTVPCPFCLLLGEPVFQEV